MNENERNVMPKHDARPSLECFFPCFFRVDPWLIVLGKTEAVTERPATDY